MTRSLKRQPLWSLGWTLAGLQAQWMLRRLGHALGLRRKIELSDADLAIPDNLLCAQTVELVRSASPPFLLHHAMRTYIFGCALARRDGLRYDRELFFLAAAMHDLGLTERYDGPGPFELEGASHAYRFLLDQEVEASRAEVVHEAIALHARVGRAVGHSPEGILVQAGAGLDVLGLRAEDLARGSLSRATRAWPREDWKRQFSSLLRDQACRKPDCNIAGHVALGFLGRVRQAPFAE